MFFKYPSNKQDIPLRRLVPNFITTTALCCGLAAIHAALQLEFKDALLFIAASMVFDALDGRAARFLRATSSFGNVLDSLSDFLSFGIAPAIILYQWMLKNEEWAGLLACMLLALCSALRLARFTAATTGPSSTTPLTSAQLALNANFFVGIPTPAAASAVLIPVLLATSRFGTTTNLVTNKWVVIAFTIFIALFMVSRQPMFSFKKLKLSRTSVVPLLVAVGLVIVGIRYDILLTLAILSGLYLLTFPLALYKHHALSRQARIEAAEPVRAEVAPA